MPLIKHARHRDLARLLLVGLGVKLALTGLALFFLADIQQAASQLL